MEVGKADSPAGGTSPIVFRLDRTSGVPTYLQLVRQVEDALLLGHLRLGDQLPRVRDVVADLAINPNTVLKAYRDLERKGLALGRPGVGTFVEAVGQPTLPQTGRLRQRLRAWLAEADAAGLDEGTIVALFTSTLRDFPERRDVDTHDGATRAGRRRAGGAA
jgi:GntR family transcriptional regulator